MKTRFQNIMLFYVGFASILSQILLVREFLAGFYGNELSIGIIFACWLLWTGIGSALGNNFIRNRKKAVRIFSVLCVLTPIVTLLQIIAVKLSHAFFSPAAGEFLSMAELFIFSFVVLSAGCVLWGILFSIGAKLLSRKKNTFWLGINKAYLWELTGSISSGLLFSFVIGSLLSTLEIVFSLIPIAVGLAVLINSRKRKKMAILLFTVTAVVYMLLPGPIRSFERSLDAYRWSFINNKLTFIRSIDTKYQNLSLLRLDDQYTVYANGRPAYNIPNTYDAEVFTHSIMVHRPDAKRILVLGGGFNGILNEILKYPVQEVEYTEIDPALLPFVEPVLENENLQSLKNEKVRIVTEDGRGYLKKTGRTYDIILLNIGEPSTAGLNRFFTREFYMECALHLSEEGIYAFSFPSSTEYIADELKDLNTSLYRTFSQVFNNTLVIPGNRAVLIGSKSRQPFISDPDSLAMKYDSYGIVSKYFSGYMYKDLMQPGRVNYVKNILSNADNVRLNTDMDPVIYYFDFLLWNRFFHKDHQYFSYITRTGIFITGGILAGLLLWILFRHRNQQEKRNKTFLKIIVACGGFAGMALNMLLLLNYQVTFGSVYEMLGVMIAANMLGIAAGTLIASVLNCNMKKLLFYSLLMLIAFILLLPFTLNSLLFVHMITFTFIIILSSGGLLGLLFGTVSRLYNSADVGSTYAFDLFGSSAGALITCSLLLPVLGIHETVYFLAIILVPAFAGAMIIERNQ